MTAMRPIAAATALANAAPFGEGHKPKGSKALERREIGEPMATANLNPPMTESSELGEERKGLLGLIDSCRAMVQGFIAKRVPSAEIEDIFQEAVSNPIEADRICRVESVAAWLFRAVKNEIIDRGRKVKEVPWPKYTRPLSDQGRTLSKSI